MEGMITLNSDFGKRIGFTSDRFSGASYLWGVQGAIVVSAIESLSFGNFGKLCYAILDLGLEVHVPTPLPKMERIVRRNGFKREMVYDDDFGCSVEVWSIGPQH